MSTGVLTWTLSWAIEYCQGHVFPEYHWGSGQGTFLKSEWNERGSIQDALFLDPNVRCRPTRGCPALGDQELAARTKVCCEKWPSDWEGILNISFWPGMPPGKAMSPSFPVGVAVSAQAGIIRKSQRAVLVPQPAAQGILAP